MRDIILQFEVKVMAMSFSLSLRAGQRSIVKEI